MLIAVRAYIIAEVLEAARYRFFFSGVRLYGSVVVLTLGDPTVYLQRG